MFQYDNARFVFEIKDDHSQIEEIRTKCENLVNETLEIPIISSSDAHQKQDVGSCFTWIKADPTYYGLKQILYEPKYRVRIQESEPVSSVRYIDSVSIDIDEDLLISNQDKEDELFCFKGEKTFHFSRNLNCIIGGRGTGKSTLLNMIHRKLKGEDNEFFEKEVKVRNQKGEPIEITEYVDVNHNTGNRIEFLNQNEIEKFALDYKKLTDAIYQRLKNSSRGKELRVTEDSNEGYLEWIDKTIKNLSKEIEITEKLEILKNDLNANKSIIEFLEDEEYKRLQNLINDKSQILSSLSRSRERLTDLLNKLKEISNKYKTEDEEDLNSFEKIIFKITSLAEGAVKRYSKLAEGKSEEETQLESEIQRLREQLSKYLSEKNVDEENIRDVSSAQEKASELESDIKELEHEKKILTEKIEEFEFDSSTKEKFEKILKELLTPVNKRLKKISIQSDQVKKIELKYEFDYERAIKNVGNAMLLDGLLPELDSGQTPGISYVHNILLELLDESMVVPPITDVREKLNQHQYSPKTVDLFLKFFKKDKNYNLFQLLVEKHRSDVNKYKVIRVKYDERAIENSSFGQRCTAAIVILLSMGNSPIVIDEPEAHLDSALIAKYLVELIKQRKQQRQIIFATHNANFVVNGDAELVHILDMDADNMTVNNTTTIENMDYRETLVNLEGGKEAFIQREKKYDFH